MKKASLIFVLMLLVIGNAFTQNKIAKQAIRNGKNSDLVYVAKAGSNSFISEHDLGRWCERNEYRYLLVDFKQHNIWFAGTDRTLISEFSFINRTDLAAYKAILAAKANQQKERQEAQQSNSAFGTLLGIAGIIVGGKLVYEGLKWAFSDKKEEEHYSTGSSSNSVSQTSSNNNAGQDYSKTDLYILSVGVSVYQDNRCLKNLNYCHIDATDIAEKLKKGEGNTFNKVYAKVLTNENATKVNIIEAISAIRSQANENDVILISVSSHGDINEANGTFYLTPNDYNCSDEINTGVNLDLIVKGIDCENCATIIWIDACHAGGASNDFNKKFDDYARSKQAQNVNLLVASDDSETSSESSRWGHGLFTQAILDGLDGLADQNDNHIVSLRELTDFVTRVVPQMRRNVCTPNPDDPKSCDQHPLNAVKLFPNTRLSTY